MKTKSKIKKPEGISAEVQKYIDDLLAEQLELRSAELQTEFEEETEGLRNKRDDLLKQVRDLKKKRANGEEDGGVGSEDLERQLEAAQKELATTKKELKKATDRLTSTEQSYNDEVKFINALVAENGLREYLIEHGVKNPVNQKAAMALLMPSVVVEPDGDKRVAKANGKPLKDFIKEWAGTDEGKHFTDASINRGGGGNGSGSSNSNNNGSDAVVMSRNEFTKLPATRQMELSRTGKLQLTD